MRRFLFAGLCLLLGLGFAGLGAWQLERRAWKRDLVARVDARLHAPPRAPRFDGDIAYTRVRVTGVLDHRRETLVQAATVLGAGWWVLTPLRTGAGVVLVNRGFVPPDRRLPASRAAGQVAGRVTLTGLVRDSEPGGAFLGRNDPAAGRWTSRDVAAIARSRRLGATAPFFIDADAAPNPGGYPVGGLTTVAFRDHHLLYAVTWFTLAALSLLGLALILRRRPAA